MNERVAPPDRRTPVEVAAGKCPVGMSCGCCMGPAGFGHFIPGEDGKPGKQITNCQMTHPATTRMCRPPVPSAIPPCPERQTLDQAPPGPPRGATCVECGRVTSRRWTDPEGRALPWCGGAI